MRQLDYDYPCDLTLAMGFRLVVVNDYSRGLGSGALHAVEELLVELGVARVVVLRRPRPSSSLTVRSR